MAIDLNGESLAVWNNLKPMIDEEIRSQTKGMVQRRKAKVTTAPSLSTGTIGVTEPFGPEYFIPFNTNLTTASVGDFVWVEFMYGATNAFASMYASADTKDWTVGGDANIIGNATINGVLDVVPRRCYANLSSAGWYRVLVYNAVDSGATTGGSGLVVDFNIQRATRAENHSITLRCASTGLISFMNEQSKSYLCYIDKIRYVYDSTNLKAYVDIHYTGSDLSSTPVGVDFSVHCSSLYMQESIVSGNLAAAATSPVSPETVLTEYTLHAKAPMSDVSSLITWDTTNYIASSSGLQVYLDGAKLVLVGSLKLKTGVNVQGAFIGTLDSSIAAKSNVWLNANYTADPASAVARPIMIYTYDSTRLRIANEATNTTGNLGSPTANNEIRINSIIPLA